VAGSKMKIESKEYTFIHHAFLIDKIVITIPTEVQFSYNQINYNSLEGRKVGE